VCTRVHFQLYTCTPSRTRTPSRVLPLAHVYSLSQTCTPSRKRVLPLANVYSLLQTCTPSHTCTPFHTSHSHTSPPWAISRYTWSVRLNCPTTNLPCGTYTFAPPARDAAPIAFTTAAVLSVFPSPTYYIAIISCFIARESLSLYE
jgi:hypothetical protein